MRSIIRYREKLYAITTKTIFIVYLSVVSTTKADHSSSQNSFEFLNAHENATLAVNGLKLAKSISEVSLSTVINTGIWWAVCKAPGLMSAMVNKHQFTEIEKQGLVSSEPDLCLQIAPLIATTETILAGQVSPWPIAPPLCRVIFLISAIYGSIIYPHPHPHQNIATTILTYLVIDGVSQTIGSKVSTAILKKKIEKTHIDDNAYYGVQDLALAGVTGLITGPIIYEVLLQDKIVESAGACFVSVISVTVASALSQIIFIGSAGFNIRDNIIRIAETAATVGTIAGAVVAAAEAWIGFIAVAVIGAGTFLGVIAVETSANPEVILGAMAVAAGGAVTGGLLFKGINRLPPNNAPLKIAGAVSMATSFALLNSLSVFAADGYPLEQSLSETTQTLWSKFSAPLDYLATLYAQITQILSEQKPEEIRSN